MKVGAFNVSPRPHSLAAATTSGTLTSPPALGDMRHFSASCTDKAQRDWYVNDVKRFATRTFAP